MTAPAREEEWHAGRSPQDSDLRVEVDALQAECSEASTRIWNSVVRFSARGVTGYVGLGGGIAQRAPDGADVLKIVGADTAAVLYAFDGARWLSNTSEQSSVRFFHGGPEVHVGEPPPPRSATGGYTSPYGRSSQWGAAAPEFTVGESSLNDLADLRERVDGRLKNAKDNEAWFRRHLDRKTSYRWTVGKKDQFTTATVDGRRLASGLHMPGDADLARRIWWAIRAAEVEAQAWGFELVAPLIAKAPSFADYPSNVGALGFDVTRGIADWSLESDPLDQQPRDLFLQDVKLERVAL